MEHKGIGALDQPEDPRDFDAGTPWFLQCEERLPVHVDLGEHLVDLPVYDQGSTNACVGFATVTAVYARSKIARIPNVVPASPLALYALGRAAATGNPRTPLMDVGSQPRLVLNAASKWGMIPESAWPFDLKSVNSRPTWSAMDKGVGCELNSYYWITTFGPQRVEDVRRVLALGYPVIAAIAVDSSLDSYTRDAILPASTGSVRGNHMITIIGYRHGERGYDFLFRNSWGPQWGDGGHGWMSSDRLTDLTTKSIAVIQTVAGEP